MNKPPGLLLILADQPGLLLIPGCC